VLVLLEQTLYTHNTKNVMADSSGTFMPTG